MRGRAHSKKLRTQANTNNVRPLEFKKIANSIKQCQCAGARIQKKTRTQANKINTQARAFKKNANSNKQNQCAGARIQTKRELYQSKSMRGRARSKKTRTQANMFDAWARAFKTNANSNKQNQCAGARIQKNANSSKHDRCAGARIQRNFELKQTRLMCGRTHSNKSRTQSNKVNARARAFKNTANSKKPKSM